MKIFDGRLTYDALDNPEKDEKIQGDPFNTLFVSRLSYDLQESDLMREFEQYGPIKNVKHRTNRERVCISY